MLKFDQFISESIKNIYRLIIDKSNTDAKDEWNLTIDMSDIWNKYQNEEINLYNFIKKYKEIINDNKENINSLIGTDEWNNLVLILNEINKIDEKEIFSGIDNVYDWADKNNVLLKS